MFDSSSDSGRRRIVVVGTGTEIGKTHVSCALLQALVAANAEVQGFKPVESGWEPSSSDAQKLALAAGHELLEPSYALLDPVSPHLAARREGRSVSLEKVLADVVALPAKVLLVETAGGLMSPLSAEASNLDLCWGCAPSDVVLVAANRLGVLHDVKVCLVALGLREGMRVRVVLSDGTAGDASTNSNADEIVRLGWAERCWSFPRAGLEDAATESVAAELARAVLS